MAAFVLKSIFLITFILSLWLSFAQAYCVYNHLDQENASIYIEQEGIQREISFKKSIGHNGKECCPYTNSDCNPYLKQNTHINFIVKFDFGDGMIDKFYFGECTGGGGLGFYGSSMENLQMFCTHADGRVASFKRDDRMFSEIPE